MGEVSSNWISLSDCFYDKVQVILLCKQGLCFQSSTHPDPQVELYSGVLSNLSPSALTVSGTGSCYRFCLCSCFCPCPYLCSCPIPQVSTEDLCSA